MLSHAQPVSMVTPNPISVRTVVLLVPVVRQLMQDHVQYVMKVSYSPSQLVRLDVFKDTTWIVENVYPVKLDVVYVLVLSNALNVFISSISSRVNVLPHVKLVIMVPRMDNVKCVKLDVLLVRMEIIVNHVHSVTSKMMLHVYRVVVRVNTPTSINVPYVLKDVARVSMVPIV